MFFKSKKNHALIQNQVPSPLKQWCDGRLRQLALYLSKKLSGMEQQLSIPQKKLILLLFLLLFGCVFTLSLYKGLSAAASTPSVFLKAPHVTVPIVPHLPDSLAVHRQFPKAPVSIDTSHTQLITK